MISSGLLLVALAAKASTAVPRNSRSSSRSRNPSLFRSCFWKRARMRSFSRSSNIMRTPAENSLKLRTPSPSMSRASKVLATSLASFTPQRAKPAVSSSLEMPPSPFAVSIFSKNSTMRCECFIGSPAAISISSERFRALCAWKSVSLLSCAAETSLLPSTLAVNHLCSRHCAMVGLLLSSKASMLLQRDMPCGDTSTRLQSGPRLCSARQSLGSKLRAQKGMSPARSSNSTQPTDHTSHFGPKQPLQTSGAMVVGVPAWKPPLLSTPANISETPRSMMTT
mmetsp:Transcript_81861/g.210893  ORF Transcript_81861/g.210893 Transcript_81861/m.210893 type:complete len:281 (-) Transcript_81861:999-1841(-)